MMGTSQQLHDALRAIYDRHKARGLKQIRTRPAGDGLDLFVVASPQTFVEHLTGLTRDGAGGCSIVIQIDGQVVFDDTEEGLPDTVWNRGRGGPHAEARARTKLLELVDRRKINRLTAVIEVWIRYSPCADRCAFVLDGIESDVRRGADAVDLRFRWYFQDFWVFRRHTQAVAEAVVQAYQQRGIFLQRFEDALLGLPIPP